MGTFCIGPCVQSPIEMPGFEDSWQSATELEKQAVGLMQKGSLSAAIAKFKEVQEALTEAAEGAPSHSEDAVIEGIAAAANNAKALGTFLKYEYPLPKK